ncbi:MAG: type IV toxin-antitoxin system AbiEi family antitoxin domain-containing protein [Actinomycetota bacterium]
MLTDSSLAHDISSAEETMPALTPAANRRLATQHGVISRFQLIDAGLSERGVSRLVARDELIEEHRAVYRIASAPTTEASRSVAVCLARPDAVIAGPTAGRYWSFRRVPDDRRIHVITPRHSAPVQRPHVRGHRTDVIAPSDIVEIADGRRILSRQRTAVDLARSVPADADLDSILEQAIAKGAVPAELLDACLPFVGPKRSWARRVPGRLARRVAGGGGDSHVEVQVGAALAEAGVAGLVRQHPLVLPDGRAIRFDLAIPSIRWAAEVDVFPTHFEADGATADARRDRACASVGWVVRRITPVELGSLPRLAERLADEITRRRLAVR